MPEKPIKKLFIYRFIYPYVNSFLGEAQGGSPYNGLAAA